MTILPSGECHGGICFRPVATKAAGCQCHKAPAWTAQDEARLRRDEAQMRRIRAMVGLEDELTSDQQYRLQALEAGARKLLAAVRAAVGR